MTKLYLTLLGCLTTISALQATRVPYSYTTRARSIPWVSERAPWFGESDTPGVDTRYTYNGPILESDLTLAATLKSQGKDFVILFPSTDWNEAGARLLPIFRTWRDTKLTQAGFGASSMYDWPEVDNEWSTKSRSSAYIGDIFCLTTAASNREHVWPAIGVYNAEGKMYAFFNALEEMTVEELDALIKGAKARYDAFLTAKAAAEATTEEDLQKAATAGELGMTFADGVAHDEAGRTITLDIYKAALLGNALATLEPNVYKLAFLNANNRLGAVFSQIKSLDPNDVSGAYERINHDDYFTEGYKIAMTEDYVPTSKTALTYTEDRIIDNRLVKKSDNQKQQGLLCGTILWKKLGNINAKSLAYARDALDVNPNSFWGIAARGRTMMGDQGPVTPYKGWKAYHLTVPTDDRAATQDGIKVTKNADESVNFSWLMRYGTDMRIDRHGWYTVTIKSGDGNTSNISFSQIKIWSEAKDAEWDEAAQAPRGAKLLFDGTQATANANAPADNNDFATFTPVTFPAYGKAGFSFNFYLPKTHEHRIPRPERDDSAASKYDDICIQLVGTAANSTGGGSILIVPAAAPIAMATPADTAEVQVDGKAYTIDQLQASFDSALAEKEPARSNDGEAVATAVLNLITGDSKDEAYITALDRNELLRQVGIGDDALAGTIKKIQYGKESLEAVLADPTWLNDFITSGPYMSGAPANTAFNRLAQLWATDKFIVANNPNSVRGALAAAPGAPAYDAHLRRMATALVLNYRAFVGNDAALTRDVIAMRNWQLYRDFMDRGLLHGDFFTQTAYQMRYALNPRAFSPNELEYAVKTTNSHLDQINGGAWQANYRLNNFFGDSIFGEAYYDPWRWTMMHNYATGRMIGAVCGGISHFGVLGANASARRSMTGGQPGHCAAWHRRFAGDKWDIDSYVSAPTGNHGAIWSEHSFYQSLEMMDDAFDDPNTQISYRLLAAAKLRQRRNGASDPAVEALYRQSIKSGPINYQALKDYALWLQANYPQDVSRWILWGDYVTLGMWRYPRVGWQLLQTYMTPVIQNNMGEAGLLAVYKQIHRRMPVSDRKTGEQYQYDVVTLNPQSGYFTNENLQLAWLETILDSRYGSTLFNTALKWGSSKYGSTSTKFNTVLNDVYEANGVKDGLKTTVYNAILNYSQSLDVPNFQSMYTLYESLYGGKSEVNAEDPLYPQTLLSANGVLSLSNYHYKASNESIEEGAVSYINARRLIDNSAFGTYSVWTEPTTETPSMTVRLPGDSEIYGIVLQNGDQNATVDVEISDDNSNWKVVTLSRALAPNEVLTIDLDGSIISRFVRTRLQNTKGESVSLKLQKFQVFGVPRY